MIWFYYGVPRTGKSLFGGLVDGIIPALTKGRHVYTNIPGLSPSGLSLFCKRPPLEIQHLLHPVANLGDVFQCFDFQADQIKPEFVNSIFILDEFRSMVGLTKTTEVQFTKILNKAAKSAVDFHLIAQLPSYFDEETRKLGEGCTVFERGDRMGKKNSTIEFMFDAHQGTPFKYGKKWDTEHWRYRTRDPKYFSCYSSYVDAAFMEANGENHRPLGFWQKKSFKISVFIGFILVCCVGVLIYLFSSTTSALDTLTSKDKQKQKAVPVSSPGLVVPEPKIRLSNDDIEPAICYESVWVNNNVVTYKLNNGNYAYNPNYLIERCSRSFVRRTDKNF